MSSVIAARFARAALPCVALAGLALGASTTAVQAAICVEEYCYDSVGRLQVALLCGTEYRYTYDAAGNRASRTVAAGTQRGVEVSLCGDMASSPALAQALSRAWHLPAVDEADRKIDLAPLGPTLEATIDRLSRRLAPLTAGRAA